MMPNKLTSANASVEKKASDSKAEEKDKESPAYLKRREQVRRAQRTHRERKENYIKALEDELLQLRARESKIVRENEALNAEVTQLREAQSWDGSQDWRQDAGVGNEIVGSTAVSNYAVSEIGYQGYNALTFNNDWEYPSYDLNDCSVSITSSESYLVPAGTSFKFSGSKQGIEVDEIPVSASSSVRELALVPTRPTSIPNLGEIDRTELAIEFVMTLEKPCLNRATSAILNIGQPHTDQALSMPKASMYHSFVEESFSPSGTVTKSDPKRGLEKLLALSSAFDLTNELTPIQAWQQIVSHPKFGMLGVKTLTSLVEDMLEYIRCYGFGAVIEKPVFDDMCRKFFARA